MGRVRRLAPLLVIGLVVAACTGGSGDDADPAATTTTLEPPATTEPVPSSSLPAPTTTVAGPAALHRPVVALPVASFVAGRTGGEMSALVASDQGLAFVRADGSTADLVAGAVRVGFTVDARRVVFQRAGNATPVELLDVITRATTVLLPGGGDRPAWLEDAGAVAERPTVLFTRRGTTEVTIVRLAIDGGTEQVITTLAPGVVPRELSMSPTHVAGIVMTGDEQRAVHFTIEGGPGPAFPEDCATRPCAAWVCSPTTDPCRSDVAASSVGTPGGYAFVELRQRDQVVTRVEDGGAYVGWVPLPFGTVVRNLQVVDYRYSIVNTWASADRTGPGRAVVVDVIAKSTFELSRAGIASAGAIVDPAPFAAAPEGDEVVTDRNGLWLLRRGAEPRRLLDHPAVFVRTDGGIVVAQRAYDPADADRPLPLLLVDVASGAAREVFSLDATSGERGLLLTAAQVDGHPEVFYRRAAPAGDATRPAGTVLLYRRALDGSPERFVASLGENLGYGSNVLQGIHVVGRTVFGLMPGPGSNQPVAFDLDGNGVEHFAGMSYCAAEGRCSVTPPTCGGDTACVSHFAVSPAGTIAWVLMSRSPTGLHFELVVVDAVGGTVLAHSLLPSNANVTLVGGVAWRNDGGLIVQLFAPNTGVVSGVVMNATVRAGSIAFAAWPFDGSAYPQSYLIG